MGKGNIAGNRGLSPRSMRCPTRSIRDQMADDFDRIARVVEVVHLPLAWLTYSITSFNLLKY